MSILSDFEDRMGRAVEGMFAGVFRSPVQPAELARLGDLVPMPGMPVEVVLRTGERSMLTYLLHPLTKRIAASMNEE